MATACGPKVSASNTASDLIQTPTWTWLYFSDQRAFISVYVKYSAWREHAFNDPVLHLKAELVGSSSKYCATNKYTHFYEAKAGIGEKEGRSFYESPSMNAPLVPTFVEEYFSNTMPCFSFETTVENKDLAPNAEAAADLSFNLIDDTKFNAWIYGYVYVFDESTDWSGTVHEGRHVRANIPVLYPPYRPFPSDGFPSGANDGGGNGGKDVSDGTSTLKTSRTYSISRAGNTTQRVSWSPTTSVGMYGLGITTKLTLNGSTYTNPSSPYSFTTPNRVASSYTAKVVRHYTDYPEVMTTSNTVTMYTYSRPTLTSISLNKYNISPRAGESLTLTLNGMNNKTWGIENNFRTGIWSNIKGKYYIDESSTSSTRNLTLDNIKTMFPDSSASNGVLNGTIYANRRNLGVSGGNPGSGNLIYETTTYSKGITIQYKPKDKINVDNEPSLDESNSGLVYYKKESGAQGAKLTAGHTWKLENDYDISKMNGVNVKIQYPKTDTSGVLHGYRIRLYLPNDGSPNAGKKWYETYWFTTDYTYTGFISYNDLKRGISGNIIEITPFYVPDGVNKNSASSGSFWYGTTVTKRFVDIAWELDTPIIDCPLNDTTWHNHQYRILFKLPVDNDTNYKGTNDIEVHYGSGKYRYQNIQVKINGVETTLGNSGCMNAHNEWNSPVSIGKAELTYKRAIIINPSLISTYKDEGTYSINIRVRKAYGQNSNWDGWSDWSPTVVVKRKTVKNDTVNRHELIMASHYMTVQTAFNLSTACYAKTASDGKAFVTKESFNRKRGDNINGPHLSPPQNTPLKTIKEYVSEFNDVHQLKNKINGYATFDTDKNRNAVKLDSGNKLLATFTPSQEFITAAKDQDGATVCDKPETVLKGRNYMKYMCDELNKLK